MDINLKIPAIEKLLDYAASGIGSVAGTMLAPWKARQEAKAKLIAAEGEVEAQRILIEGQAHSMQIIAGAQADARAQLVSHDATVQGQLEFGAAVTQRIQFQEEKKQSNIAAVIAHAAQELGDRRVQDHEVDHDWTARFFNDVQDVSSEEMQQFWSKILAGEVERPGSTSIKTLGILKNLDRVTANLFENLCSICISVRPDGNRFYDARVLFLGGYSQGKGLRDYGFDFDELNILSEHGLISQAYNTWYDYVSSIGLNKFHSQPRAHIPISFQGKYWILSPTEEGTQREKLELFGVALTGSGQEISRVVDLIPAEKYALQLFEYFREKNLEMTEVPI